MSVGRPGRWRAVQLLLSVLVGGGLVVAGTRTRSLDVGDPSLLVALGAVLIAYALLAASWEALLVGKDFVTRDQT